MQGLFKRQQAAADIEPGVLIINAAPGREGTITITAILDTQLKINLPPTLNVGTGGGSPVSSGTAGNRDRSGLVQGKDLPQSWEQGEKPSRAPSWEQFGHLGIYDFLFISAFGTYDFL